MTCGIGIVLHEARLRSVDSMVAAHGDVFAGVPFCASLAENDVARYHIFLCIDALLVNGFRKREMSEELGFRSLQFPLTEVERRSDDSYPSAH